MSDSNSKEPSRRDFIYVATAAAGAVTDRQKIVSGSATVVIPSGSNLRAFGGLGDFNVNIGGLSVTKDELRESLAMYVNGQLMLSGTVGQVGTGKADYHIISGSDANHVSMILGFDLIEEDKLSEILKAFQMKFPNLPIYPISSLKGEGLENLKEELFKQI